MNRRAVLGAGVAAAASLLGRRANAQMPTTSTRVIGPSPAADAPVVTARPVPETRIAGAEAERTARWIAGLDAADPSAEWSGYAARENVAWKATETRVRSLRAFARRELAPLLPAGRPLLYPFAGPDALHAVSLFAEQPRLVLIGLEPVRPLPAPGQAPPGYFDRLGDAMSDLHRLAFFRTRAMASDFDDDGVAGALAATVARLGGRVTSIETADDPPRVRLDWTTPEGAARRLDYASVDMSNAGMRRAPRFFAAVAADGPHVTFLKAASFLLGEPLFTQTARFLLGASAVIVQDDSGLPFHDLDHGWALRFFGRYVKPGSPFEDRAQPDLAAAFARRAPPRLPFVLGYHSQAEASHLLVASKEP